MATTEAVLAALAQLQEDLDTGAWVPDEYDRAIGVAVQTEGRASAETIRAGLRAAGPEGAGSRLAPVAARCGYLLDGMSGTNAEDRRAVQAALGDVLDLVVLAGVRRS
ncbi:MULTISPECIES: hypothetical protein [unclassified Streptomyces]|uniref:hypothetical protein n=1 Tax=unclassified Streptomyces TaxID=2593676 RepID=UPI002365E80A|nr:MULTISPECIES: hypothetical protein [unclassified Streptomyces]MDF3142145.1 hypothetical protein [Streptomyces sp. T21Q-yed]WDF43574.1 hypothetical protein PBV52_45760 [Streptomyces sp. T12]